MAPHGNVVLFLGLGKQSWIQSFREELVLFMVLGKVLGYVGHILMHFGDYFPLFYVIFYDVFAVLRYIMLFYLDFDSMISYLIRWSWWS